jgi:hypothetical protein
MHRRLKSVIDELGEYLDPTVDEPMNRIFGTSITIVDNGDGSFYL